MIPIVAEIIHYRKLAPAAEQISPYAIIIVPSRELAIQVKDEARVLSVGTFFF